jgi:anthranilate synthase/aminodeoxychorismate synthase-like glutamine amidotransferase
MESTASTSPSPPLVDTLMIDNYDSFTYNIVQYLEELGTAVTVKRNDAVTIEEIKSMNPKRIVISPGPGNPSSAGISNQVIREFKGKVPILGVCLGLQCMFEVFGGTVSHAGEVVHGKQSEMYHDGKGVFKDIPSPFLAVRYHSLAGVEETIPTDELEVTCRTKNNIIQGVRHKIYNIEGVQFHPESIKTEYGKELFMNFIKFESGLRT